VGSRHSRAAAPPAPTATARAGTPFIAVFTDVGGTEAPADVDSHKAAVSYKTAAARAGMLWA
jgi:hypothetical protein